METKQQKNEELQSRREFFKEAAKKTLPVIGLVALGGIQISAFASNNGVTSLNMSELNTNDKPGVGYKTYRLVKTYDSNGTVFENHEEEKEFRSYIAVKIAPGISGIISVPRRVILMKYGCFKSNGRWVCKSYGVNSMDFFYSKSNNGWDIYQLGDITGNRSNEFVYVKSGNNVIRYTDFLESGMYNEYIREDMPTGDELGPTR